MNKKLIHLYQLDSLRVLAILGVVVIHVVTNEVGPGMGEYSTMEWLIREIFVLSFRWVVPVFVMISGALILGSTQKISYGSFITKRLSKIGIPLLAWSVLYFVFFNLTGSSLSIEDQLRRTFVDGYPAYHLYFVYIILGLYVVSPILKSIVRSAHAWPVTIGLLIGSSLWSVWTVGINQQWHFSGLNAATFWIPFSGYFMLGFLLNQRFTTASIKRWGVLGGISLVLMIGGSVYLKNLYGYTARGLVFHDYLEPIEIVLSSAVFLLALKSKSMQRLGQQSWIRSLSQASFGIYLCHWIVLWGVNKVIVSNHLLLLDLKISLVFGISYLVVWVVLKVPLLRVIVGGR